MEIYTIGLAGRTAEDFFEALVANGIQRLVDVRLHNSSQLAGFSKRGDLPFFVDRLVHAKYEHELRLAPTDELLKSYRRKAIDWNVYAAAYNQLVRARQLASPILESDYKSHRSALLCSERQPAKCHRRLAAEFLAREWQMSVTHL